MRYTKNLLLYLNPLSVEVEHRGTGEYLATIYAALSIPHCGFKCLKFVNVRLPTDVPKIHLAADAPRLNCCTFEMPVTMTLQS